VFVTVQGTRAPVVLELPERDLRKEHAAGADRAGEARGRVGGSSTCTARRVIQSTSRPPASTWLGGWWRRSRRSRTSPRPPARSWSDSSRD